jgi:Zn finger protein HypA/HybF involved in hydrogenase expression
MKTGSTAGQAAPSRVVPEVDLSLDRITMLIEEDENCGICRACGATAYGVEPDARRYECEECGASEVYGAEELLIMVQP